MNWNFHSPVFASSLLWWITLTTLLSQFPLPPALSGAVVYFLPLTVFSTSHFFPIDLTLHFLKNILPSWPLSSSPFPYDFLSFLSAVAKLLLKVVHIHFFYFFTTHPVYIIAVASLPPQFRWNCSDKGHHRSTNCLILWLLFSPQLDLPAIFEMVDHSLFLKTLPWLL